MKTFIGMIRAELYFREAQSLKDRRSHLRSLQTRLRNTGFSVAQVGPVDFVKQAWIAAVCVSGSNRVASDMTETAARLFHNPSWEVTSLETDVLEAPEAEAYKAGGNFDN